MNDTHAALSTWIGRHAFFVWLGIVLNGVFIAMLLFDPAGTLANFGIQITQTIWPRFAAILLIIVSVFYVPATINFRRYEVFAWLAVFPSRTFGAVFFFLAVFVFGQPYGFLVGVLIDGFVGITTLICLMRIAALDAKASALGAPA